MVLSGHKNEETKRGTAENQYYRGLLLITADTTRKCITVRIRGAKNITGRKYELIKYIICHIVRKLGFSSQKYIRYRYIFLRTFILLACLNIYK